MALDICAFAQRQAAYGNPLGRMMLNIPLRDYFRETRIFNSRLMIVAGAIGLLVIVILFRLIYLQLINQHHYTTLSKANSIRPIPIPPARGLILDRNGTVLAQNYPVYTLEITPHQVKDMKALIKTLSGIIKITDYDKKIFYRLIRRHSRYENIPLRTHLNDAEAARIASYQTHLNGVELQARLQRHYPLGALTVHFIGYVGRINEEDTKKIKKSLYHGTQHIGKLGLERYYEKILLGRVGVKQVESNAHGRHLRTLKRLAPKAGQNLHLHIDAGMQAYAERAMGKRRGAVIALNPRTGGILTFVSTPTYNPNPFVNGIDTKSYKALLDDPDKPLINRALSGRYAPGSTIKPFLALGALSLEEFNPKRQVYCPGYFYLPGSRHRFRDWKKTGHGSVNLNDAIVQSCDVYFYQLAVMLGIDRIKKFLNIFGFGYKTGIDMPDEVAGLVPSPEWSKRRGINWALGDTVVTGIGQGPLLVTPLQLASAVATLANRGVRMRPTLVYATEDPGSKQYKLVRNKANSELPAGFKEKLPEIITSMTNVVHDRRGTGIRIGWNAPYKIAGKTGTAQVISIGQKEKYDAKKIAERLRDHALFIAFAPVENPQIAVAVIVENGGHGSSAAAPIARKLMDFYLLNQPAFE